MKKSQISLVCVLLVVIIVCGVILFTKVTGNQALLRTQDASPAITSPSTAVQQEQAPTTAQSVQSPTSTTAAFPPKPAEPSAETWTDPATGLMWERQDNGSDVTWNQADSYCSNLTLAGYSNWRLATIDELEGIYDQNVNAVHIKGGIRLSGVTWSSSTDSGEALVFLFSHFKGAPARDSFRLDYGDFRRALCVRRSEK